METAPFRRCSSPTSQTYTKKNAGRRSWPTRSRIRVSTTYSSKRTIYTDKSYSNLADCIFPVQLLSSSEFNAREVWCDVKRCRDRQYSGERSRSGPKVLYRETGIQGHHKSVFRRGQTAVDRVVDSRCRNQNRCLHARRP